MDTSETHRTPNDRGKENKGKSLTNRKREAEKGRERDYLAANKRRERGGEGERTGVVLAAKAAVEAEENMGQCSCGCNEVSGKVV